MQVSVETVKGLQRKMTVSVPGAEIESEISRKLNSLKNKVRIDGFRPGKVPPSVIKKRYGDALRADVLGELIQRTYGEALAQEKINPAGDPKIDMAAGADKAEDFTYTAEFEVYPEIKLGDFTKFSIEKPQVEIGDDDVANMIEKLREQNRTWQEVERKARDSDRLTIDFTGFINGEEFKGGKAKDMAVILGSNSMIDGFEKGLEGLMPGAEISLDLKFPEKYHKEDLSGKDVRFEVKVSKVEESVLPEVDSDFARKFGIEDGDVEALKQQIIKNMQRECSHYLRQYLKNQVTQALQDAHNDLEIPGALIEQEVKVMVDNLKQQMQGGNVDDLANTEHMHSEAERRVRLGLVMGEVIDRNELKLDEAKLDEFIKDEAASYEDPQQFIDYYKNNTEATNALKPMVMEQQVVDYIIERSAANDVKLKFDELVEKVQPKQA